MMYQERQPHPLLAGYIDAVWTSTGNDENRDRVKILPDGCVDLIMNLGDDCKTDNGARSLRHGSVYMVGTMSKYKLVDIDPGTKLLGVRFKPAGFSAFYSFSSMHELVDCTVDVDKKLLPDLRKPDLNRLTQFFLDKLRVPKHNLLPVISDIKLYKGQISIPVLAKRHFITVRQLERNFKYHIGMTPKEFINFVRYQCVLPVIKSRTIAESLSDIALAHGYCDHAHLANEIKHYTGDTPSQLSLIAR